ncbi:hypothetical protein OPT61_g8512 [Boeremia exigua]|uniref:Uncharacterized protein n=1 Tax=Boeremia exigua TaxID=749465 RepID=A0ACC2HYW6_9PLEO|nr:hypothetical protein OPT61_g8512 [Boeremia exigua]
MPPNGTSVTITNPLVLYRSLIATQQIRPDPGQHRLALHLQKLYDQLKDYEPRVEYSKRLNQLTRAVDAGSNVPSGELGSFDRSWIWKTLVNQKEQRDSRALTRVLTDHDQAMALQSPRGLMLHGEVGTGKSMLIDLFQESLPTRKKKRWHFDTFMLHTISRLEQLRKSRALTRTGQDEYSLLLVARDLIETSPILFLDEFQFPDRVASKVLSNLMTSFFQLGGVLIATSNRMPDELAKAAGVEFARPAAGGAFSKFGWANRVGFRARNDGAGQKGEFFQFLELLKARCEVWEMEGKRDYRKLEIEEGGGTTTKSVKSKSASDAVHRSHPPEALPPRAHHRRRNALLCRVLQRPRRARNQPPLPHPLDPHHSHRLRPHRPHPRPNTPASPSSPSPNSAAPSSAPPTTSPSPRTTTP